jgi:hypothetical protein
MPSVLLISRSSGAAEPPFDESFVEEMPEAAIRDAARESVVGLPFALVWRVVKNR